MRLFDRTIGIDYSGAETPTSGLKGLRVYTSEAGGAPVEALPSLSMRKYWTRRGIAEWLADELAKPVKTLVGIDHGFSFPMRYFEKHRIKPDWETFLHDFRAHWPTHENNTYVDFVRHGLQGLGSERWGDARWRRLCEEVSGSAKSVFHFDVQGSVAKSTHSGLPWLLHIREKLGGRVHFWPFEGWQYPPDRSVVVEVYPRLMSGNYPVAERTPDQHDAYCVAAWMADQDKEGALAQFFNPPLTLPQRQIAQIEGWIFGLMKTELPTSRAKSRSSPAREDRPAPKLRPSAEIPDAGFVNGYGQVVIRRTLLNADAEGARTLAVHCSHCDAVYGASSRAFRKCRCPSCQDGLEGLPYRLG